MAKGLYNKEVIQSGVGLHTDKDPINQPKGTYRFALNAVNESADGKHNSISNEKANYSCTNKPAGFEIIGDCYLEGDTSAVILVNPETGKEQIGLIEKNNVYRTVVDTSVLGLDITKQCEIKFRLRRGSERVIYWVDGLNGARTFNFDREYNFYNTTYQAYIRSGGNPNTYVGEKWDESSFNLIKTYELIPNFSNVEVLETGSILPGSYNFAIQYVDEDLNPTEWITTSNTVNIFNDSANSPFGSIRGSRNSSTSEQTFTRANKSIRLTITNLDSSFPYYRVAIISANVLNGQPNKALLSDLYSTSDSIFTYSGNDSNLAETDIGEIVVDTEVVLAPDHIEQLENRLLLANTEGPNINWCEFQKYASKIASDFTTKEVILNNILSEPNIKNPKSTFFFKGYMPGEVYSFGIVYIVKTKAGYIESPAFHIPGRSQTHPTSTMKFHDLSTKYLNVHNCATQNYWGKDSEGNNLVGENIRHHRFPFRKEVNKPLYTKISTPITVDQYTLQLKLELNPAWVGPAAEPNFWPVDGLGDPLLLSFSVNYKLTTQPTQQTFNTNVNDSDLGVDITVYQDVTPLDDIDTPRHYILNNTCDIFSYQDPTGSNYYLVPRFIITETYGSTVLSTSLDNDVSEIFGIEFSAIEKPHPDVVGFYIVRNERMDDDKLIIDNAIFGPTTEYNQYKSFGLLMPKQISGKPDYYDKAAYFFNPEFQFFNKRQGFNGVEIEGLYTEDTLNYPTYRPDNGQGDPAYGVYIDDVQAGTSYNPDINKKKDKDDDGFDLLIGHRNTNLTFALNNVLVFPVLSDALYVSPASYKVVGNDVFYNTSVDNRIGMFITSGTFDTTLFYNSGTTKNGLIYGALTRNSNSSYSNFLTRTYYKEHNNPVLFGNNSVINNLEIFNGDAQISSVSIVSSVFYDMVVADRAKKSKIWKIIVGSLLIVASVAAAILTAGASIPASIAGISTGISLISAGITFERMKNMFEADYEKGLKETVFDKGLYDQVRDTICTGDDTIRWFADRLNNVYIESAVPFGLRDGLTNGNTDFVNSPEEYNEDTFRTYLIEKFTLLDRDQGSGRLYRGMPTAELYSMNFDYLRFNKQTTFSHLPAEYDCCADSDEGFPMRIWYSEQSFQEEKVDNYRVFLPNNYRDIEGEHGEITGMYRLGNSLFIHTREALWHLPQNIQERVNSDLVSLIGTGEFFSVPPTKVVDDKLGSAGTQHKWATVKTKNGVIFVNEVENKVYLHSKGIQDITLSGMRNWFENNLKPNITKQLFDKFRIEYPHANNPANPLGVGYLSVYDTRLERVIITKKDYSILPDKLAQLVLLAAPGVGSTFSYVFTENKFYLGQEELSFDNEDYFENKSWTISFSFHTNTWISWHSYLPNYYIHNQNSFYSVVAGNSSIWKHNVEGKYHTYYGVYAPHIIEIVKVSNPLQSYITEDLIIQTIARQWDDNLKDYNDVKTVTFNKILAYNSYQSSGEKEMLVKEATNNPQNWYLEQIKNTAGQVSLTRAERNWHINDFRDYVVNYNVPLFSTRWQDIKAGFFIDKVVNSGAVSNTKPWHELQTFNDKYLIVRLKFDTFDNVNLTLNYSLETEQPTIH
jgi:hypothetical protein